MRIDINGIKKVENYSYLPIERLASMTNKDGIDTGLQEEVAYISWCKLVT